MSSVTYCINLILIIVSIVISQQVYAVEYEKKCGNYIYGVEVLPSGEDYVKLFKLYYKEGTQEKKYFTTVNGQLYLTASCVQDTKGKYYFLFQKFCGSNNCADEPNSLYDPETKKMVLEPDEDMMYNNGNKAEKILGYFLPIMFDDERTFCCDYKQAPVELDSVAVARLQAKS